MSDVDVDGARQYGDSMLAGREDIEETWKKSANLMNDESTLRKDGGTTLIDP